MELRALSLPHRTTVLLSRSALADNVRWLRNYLPAGTKLMAVVKANAYGHGASLVAPELQAVGVDAFGVATTVEAEELRTAGITAPVYLLGPVLSEEVDSILKARAVCLVQDVEFTRALSERAMEHNLHAEVHLKVDVGMSRFGVQPQHAEEVAVAIDLLPGVCLTGIASHFPCADSDPKLTRRQWQVFCQTAECVMNRLGRPLVRHVSASAGVLAVPEAAADMVRCGLLVYGVAPSGYEPHSLGLSAVLSMHSRVVALRQIPPGTAVGYGATFIAERETLVATVPVGYGDGYLRTLGNRAQVLLRGRRVPVIGRVCMDQMMIDATDTGAQIGDVVTLIGQQGGAEITVNEVARWLDTTPHEVTTLLSARVRRMMID